MKRKLIHTLLCVFATILSGCSSRVVKNENAHYAFSSYEHEALEINANTVKYMLDNDFSFSLFMYTEACSSCQKGKELIDEYVKKNPYQIYQIEMETNAVNSLEKYSDVFKGLSYPTLMCFNQGKLTYTITSKSFKNYTGLKKVLSPQMIETDIYTLNKKENLNAFINEREYFLTFTYDSFASNCKEAFNYFYSKAKTGAGTTLILDKSAFDSSIDLTDNSLILFENGQIKTTVNYLSDDGNYKLLIDSFFDIDTVDRSF